MSKSLEQILEKLKELKEIADECNHDDKSSNANIAECAITIEHKKFELAQLFAEKNITKKYFLMGVNIARFIEINIYNFFFQAINKHQPLEGILKDMRESFENDLKGLKMLAINMKKDPQGESSHDYSEDQ